MSGPELTASRHNYLEGLCAVCFMGGIFMEAVFDYNVVLNQAVQKIRDIRAPRSMSRFIEMRECRSWKKKQYLILTATTMIHM